MIISKNVEVTISNQGKYFKSLGYTNTKQGTKIIVPIEHLPSNSNKMVLCKCDECDLQWTATYQSVKKQTEIDRCFSCNRKHVGTINGASENAKKRNSSYIGSNHPRWNPNKKSFAAYSYKVRRITEENYKEYKHIINPSNLPRTLCGVPGGYQLDHKISLKWAYSHGLNSKIAGSIDNLQMLSWKNNRQKAHK